jgi:hypothetical protein
MLNNYVALPFTYDANTLLSVVDTSDRTCTPCKKLTVIQVSKILKVSIPIKSILYFKLQPLQPSVIHIDTNISNKNNDSEFALNLPLLNSDKVLMKWYSDNNPNIDFDIYVGPNGTSTPSILENRVTLIDQLYYTNPHIVKINTWHSVQNESIQDIAHFISLRFYSPLDLVMNKLL